MCSILNFLYAIAHFEDASTFLGVLAHLHLRLLRKVGVTVMAGLALVHLDLVGLRVTLAVLEFVATALLRLVVFLLGHWLRLGKRNLCDFVVFE